MNLNLLIPPLAFSIIFIAISVLSYIFSKLAFKKTTPISEDSQKSYSCGEEFDPKDLDEAFTCSDCGEEFEPDDLEDGLCPGCRVK